MSPLNVLGMNTEAYDIIRVEHECHITYDRKQNAFIVYGDTDASVKECLERMYGLLCEIATKNRIMGNTATRAHIVAPPHPENLQMDVLLDTKHAHRNRQITIKRQVENNGVECRMSGRKQPARNMKAWNVTRGNILKSNDRYLRELAQRGLEDTVSCRAHLSMKVNFGSLVLFGYRKPANGGQCHDMDTFLEMMRNKDVQSELIRRYITSSPSPICVMPLANLLKQHWPA